MKLPIQNAGLFRPGIAGAACLVLLGMLSSVQGARLFEMNFNETGTTAGNSGTTGGNATLVDYSQNPTDFHSSAGGGVSGQSSDRSFDNTASNQMGGNGVTAGQGGAAVIMGGASLFNGLQSFTIAGWYNGASTPGNNARLLSAGNVNVYFTPTGINLSVAGVSASSAVTGAVAEYLTANRWEFFAISYNGASTANNVTFYSGFANGDGTLSPLTSVTLTLANGVLKSTSPSSAPDLAIGNTLVTGGSTPSVLNRPFDGYLDEFAVWGSTTDLSGVLDQSAINGFYTQSAIPEPHAYIPVAMAFLSLVLASRRHSRTGVPACPNASSLNGK